MGWGGTTGAAIVDIVGFGTIDDCCKLSTLAIAGIGVGLYGCVGDFAEGVNIEIDGGCSGYGLQIPRDKSNGERAPDHSDVLMIEKKREWKGAMGTWIEAVSSWKVAFLTRIPFGKVLTSGVVLLLCLISCRLKADDPAEFSGGGWQVGNQ